MTKNRTALFLPILAVGLIFFFSGCYTRVASYDESGTTYWERDTTTQSQSYNYDNSGGYGDNTYVGFDYYTPSPYWGYDSWYYNGYYNTPWYFSPSYYSSAYMGYPFLYYPYYPYPYYYPHHHYYAGLGYYGGYNGYTGYGNYGGVRNSGYTRRGSLQGLFENTGRRSSNGGSGFVASPGSGYALPSRTGNQTAGAANAVPTRTTRTNTVRSGSAVPTRGSRTYTIPTPASVPSRGQTTRSQQPGAANGSGRSGYTRSSGESRHEGMSRPTYTPPSYVPSRASAPHYSPPPSSSGRSGGSSGGRSSGGSGGRRR